MAWLLTSCSIHQELFQLAGFLANTKEADFFVRRNDGNQPRGLDTEAEGVRQQQATELLVSL
jgi:hypothetical protein